MYKTTQPHLSWYHPLINNDNPFNLQPGFLHIHVCYWINLDVRVSSPHIFFPVSLSDIHEVRSGHETDTFRISKNQSKYPKEKCFSLITGADNHTVNLVAPSQEDAKVWIHGLRWLKKKSQHIDIHAKQAAYPLQHWLRPK